MHLAIVSYHHEPGLDPQALLDLYPTLTGWAEAVAASTTDTRVTVIQRCARDAEIKRNGVHYQLLADGARPVPQPWAWPRRVHQPSRPSIPIWSTSTGSSIPCRPGCCGGRCRRPRRW